MFFVAYLKQKRFSCKVLRLVGSPEDTGLLPHVALSHVLPTTTFS